ncbi:tetratricopeptide repeat protein [Streptantibioticus silvisoli]|uniref:tetratricopeptide repeat protein n=1 Tax=Streptantibioticus silvisoli TaxID=2705255 RepID=UPI0027E272A5|nr:tetratricopeptide repeat protein [Streptantibioticus silvisoli]
MPDQVADGAGPAERRAQLPAGPPYFAGRRRELAELRADIDRPGLDALGGRPAATCRVLLVAGRPGSGRTALAARLVRSLAGRYPDGVLYARLTDHHGEPVPSDRAAAVLLAAAPGLLPASGAYREDPAAALRAALTGRRAVLLLDDATGADQVLPLLPAGPGCLVVATAAGPLSGVPDVRPCTLGGLEPEAGVDLLSAVIGEIRVTVDPTAARTLTETCAGNPAALRMVGGWLAARPGKAVTDAVRALRELSGPPPHAAHPSPAGPHAAGPGAAGPHGHHAAGAGGSAASAAGTRHACAGGSYPAASPFDGPYPVPAAAGGSAAGQSGVPAPHVPADAAPPGSSACAAGPASAVPSPAAPGGQSAARGHPVLGVPRASVPLTGDAPGGGVRWMPSAVPAPAPAEPPSGPAMRAFHLVYGTFPAATARMLRLLALAPGGLADAHVASALAGTTPEVARETLFDLAAHGLVRPDVDGYRLPGWLAPHLASLVRTGERPEEVRLARARMLERTVRLVQSCRAMAGDEEEGARRAEDLPRAVRFASRHDAEVWLAARRPQLLDAAAIAADDGELDTLARRLITALVRALDAYDDGTAQETGPAMYTLHSLLLRIAERRGLPRDRAAALINLADLDMAADRVKEAVGRYRTALDAARTADDPTTTGRALEALGGAYLRLGDPERSADWFGRALALRQTRGELAEVAAVHGRLGELYRDHRRFTAGLREWRAAAAVHRRLRDTAGYAAALGEAARTQLMAGRPEEALRGGHEALHWARQAADARVEGLVLLVMADTLDRLGDPAGARLQRDAAAVLLDGSRPARGPAAPEGRAPRGGTARGAGGRGTG